MSSSTLEALDCPSIEESDLKWAYSPLASEIAFARAWASVVAALAANAFIISQKTLILAKAGALRPYSAKSVRNAALNMEVSLAEAIKANAPIEVSPIPRVGIFTTLLKDSSSLTLTTSFR